jgi:CHAD domain-containing protein
MTETIGEYARRQAATLLDRLAYQVSRAARRSDAETIHDLRVSIRRFTQCLRVFGQFLPGGKRKKIRKKLRGAMELAAEVRNCDITIELLSAAGVSAQSQTTRTLRQRRDAAQKLLTKTVKTWNQRNFSRRWRENLEL